MSKQNGSPDPLRPSSPDAIALGEAVEERFLNTCGTYLRVNGVRLMIPPSLNADALRWRAMRVRHRRGDFRNSVAELKATRAVAQWTLDVNADLRHQPHTLMQWKD